MQRPASSGRQTQKAAGSTGHPARAPDCSDQRKFYAIMEGRACAGTAAGAMRFSKTVCSSARLRRHSKVCSRSKRFWKNPFIPRLMNACTRRETSKSLNPITGIVLHPDSLRSQQRKLAASSPGRSRSSRTTAGRGNNSRFA